MTTVQLPSHTTTVRLPAPDSHLTAAPEADLECPQSLPSSEGARPDNPATERLQAAVHEKGGGPQWTVDPPETG